MLLMKLETKEKFSFLQLAHYLARIDNNFGEKEEELILEYCAEMGIENIDTFPIDTFSLEHILNDFKSKKSQKIVLLELMVLIHIDNNLHINEKELVEKINTKFNFSIDEVEDFSQWGKSVAMLFQVANIFIEEDKL